MDQPVEKKPSRITRFARRFLYPCVAWIARLKRRRFVIALVALFGVAGAVFGFAETAHKYATAVINYFSGDPAVEEQNRKHLASAFTMGVNLGEYVFLEDHFRQNPPPSPQLNTLKARSDSCAEVVKATAAGEGIAVDVRKLQTQPLLDGHWDSSHGYRFLRDAIRSKGGAGAAVMFETAFFLAIFQKKVSVSEFQLTGSLPFQDELKYRLNAVKYLGMPEYKVPNLIVDASSPADKENNKSALRLSLLNWEHDVKKKLKL